MRFNASQLIALVAIGTIPASALPVDKSSTGLAARDLLAPELAGEAFAVVTKRVTPVYPLHPPPGKTTKDIGRDGKLKKTPGYQKSTESSRNKKVEKKKGGSGGRGKRSIDEAADEAADEAFAVVAKRVTPVYPLHPPPGKTTKDIGRDGKLKKTPGYQKSTESSRNKKVEKKKGGSGGRGKRSIDEAADEDASASS